jgi:hypothetical protein
MIVSQRRQQMFQAVVINFVHEREQPAQLPGREPLAREPVQDKRAARGTR